MFSHSHQPFYFFTLPNMDMNVSGLPTYSTGRLKKCGFSALNTTPPPTHSLSRLCLLEWLAIAHHSPVGFDALHLLERLNPTRDGSSEDNGFEYGYLSPEVPCLT